MSERERSQRVDAGAGADKGEEKGSDMALELLWLDMEMSGLDPARERILEVAAVLTRSDLSEIAATDSMVVHQPESVLAGMDDWNQKHHGDSGLIEGVRRSLHSEAEVEAYLVRWLDESLPSAGPLVLAGNSVHHDRLFLQRYMPALAKRLHYRNLDVSTVKELARRWYPEVLAQAPKKQERHRALDDIRESLDELRYYRRTLFP